MIEEVNGKCNFRCYGQLCYLKLERVIGYVEHGKCDGEENCILFMKGAKQQKEEKPICTEICPDPDLIRIVDGHGADMDEETKAAIARNRARIANCHWKKEYKCKWD